MVVTAALGDTDHSLLRCRESILLWWCKVQGIRDYHVHYMQFGALSANCASVFEYWLLHQNSYHTNSVTFYVLWGYSTAIKLCQIKWQDGANTAQYSWAISVGTCWGFYQHKTGITTRIIVSFTITPWHSP